MEKTLVKNGNSLALILSKEMLGHIGVTSVRTADGKTVPDERQVDVQFVPNGILITPKRRLMSFEEALDASGKKYENALKNLAK